MSLLLSLLCKNGGLSFFFSFAHCVPFLFFFTFPPLFVSRSCFIALLSFLLPSTRSSQCTGAMLRVQEFRIRKKHWESMGFLSILIRLPRLGTSVHPFYSALLLLPTERASRVFFNYRYIDALIRRMRSSWGVRFNDDLRRPLRLRVHYSFRKCRNFVEFRRFRHLIIRCSHSYGSPLLRDYELRVSRSR